MADNESNLSLENARRVAKILRPLAPEARNELLKAKSDGDFQGFQKIAFENRLDASSIWTGIDDLWQQTAQGVEIPLEESDPIISSSDSKGPGIVGTGALAAKVLLDRKEGTYERFQEDSERYADHAHKTWEEEEKERLKNPSKFRPKPGRAGSAQEAYDRAHREYHEMFARTDPEKAKKWLAKNPANTSLAMAINKTSVENKKITYKEFLALKNGHVKTAIDDWEGRNPQKRYRDRLTTAAQAHDEIYDHLTLNNPEAVKKWAEEYNDPELYAALKRKRQRDIAQARDNQGRISRALGRDPSAKFGAEITPPASGDVERLTEAEKTLGTNLSGYQKRTLLEAHEIGLGEKGKDGNPAGINNYTQDQISQKARALRQAGFDKEQRRKLMEAGIVGNKGAGAHAWTPYPANTMPGSQTPSVIKNQTTPNELTGAQESASDPKRKGLRGRLNYYRPSQIRARAIARTKNRILNTKAGKAFQKSKLGRFSSKANVFKNKLKKFLNPLNYLLSLIKKSIIGALLSAIASVLSAVISMAVSIAVGVIVTSIGIFSAVVTFIMSTVGLPLVIVIIVVALMFLVFTIQIPCLIFCEDESGNINESQYPGISYFILGPYSVPNGDHIDYTIGVIYDESRATRSLSEITLFSDVPPGTRLVASGTTGEYTLDPASDNVSWKLTSNAPSSENDNVTAYQFKLRLDPDDDITVDVTISLTGAGSGGGGPPVAGGDCGGKYNSRNSEKGNFGDPSCDHSKNAAADLMSQLDPANAPFWYLVAECESSHWPNAFNGNAVESTGAWGMYQMGAGSSFSYPWTSGQLPWRQQTEVAFKRETEVAETQQYNNPFDYWQCENNACQDAPQLCTNGEYNVQGRTW